jgi:hypothetical protein
MDEATSHFENKEDFSDLSWSDLRGIETSVRKKLGVLRGQKMPPELAPDYAAKLAIEADKIRFKKIVEDPRMESIALELQSSGHGVEPMLGVSSRKDVETAKLIMANKRKFEEALDQASSPARSRDPVGLLLSAASSSRAWVADQQVKELGNAIETILPRVNLAMQSLNNNVQELARRRVQ